MSFYDVLSTPDASKQSQATTRATHNLPVTSLLDRHPPNLLGCPRCATSPSPFRQSPVRGGGGNGQLQKIVDTEILGA
jgi:hypothetical protein